MFGDSEDEALSGIMLAGIAVTDSMVYVMESGRAALWLLRPDLSVVRRVGREGQGPGEWRPFGVADYGGSMRWIHASDAGVRLFDGARIQAFSADGRFRRMLLNGAQEAGLSPMQSRLVHVGDTLLYTGGGYDVMASIARGGPLRQDDLIEGRSRWWVWMRANGKASPVLHLGLTPLRKVTVGPAQARPLWDSNGRCVVASDGAEPLLVYTAIGSGRQDTMTVPLPDRVARVEDYVEKMAGLLPPGERLEPPSAPTRVRDLVIDPDGFVWLLPVQPREADLDGVEVVRVPLGGGPAVRDTVRAFPRAFGEPGVFYSEVYGADGELLVARYARPGLIASQKGPE